jgi:hypothetical protein
MHSECGSPASLSYHIFLENIIKNNAIAIVFACFVCQSVAFADDIACVHRIFSKDRESVCIEKSKSALKELGFKGIASSGISTYGKDTPVSVVIACDSDRGVAFIAVAGPSNSDAPNVCSAIDGKWKK